MRTGILGLMRTGILGLMRTGIRHIFSKCESIVDARHTKVRITHQCVLSTLCSVVTGQRSIVDPSPSSGSTSVGRFNCHHLALGLFHSLRSVITSRQYLFTPLNVNLRDCDRHCIQDIAASLQSKYVIHRNIILTSPKRSDTALELSLYLVESCSYLDKALVSARRLIWYTHWYLMEGY